VNATAAASQSASSNGNTLPSGVAPSRPRLVRSISGECVARVRENQTEKESKRERESARNREAKF